MSTHPTRTNEHPRSVSRRVAVAALAATPLLAWAVSARAQDDEGEGEGNAEGTPATSPPIVGTGVGEVPTTGGRRPGPLGEAPPDAAARPGVVPFALEIEPIGVSAEVEPRRVVDGVMEDPTGPWVVAWYENLGSPGDGGNTVMAGHIDYWNVGPSVFFRLAELQPDAEVVVTGEDGGVFRYAVESVDLYDAENAPLDEIVGDSGRETLTLITCGGTFDYTNAEYLSRTVVRANRVREDAAGA